MKMIWKNVSILDIEGLCLNSSKSMLLTLDLTQSWYDRSILIVKAD